MATVSSLSAPGVEVREYDNSLRITSNTGTTVFVPGYAAQGPVEEVIQISSISDFENTYGIPTTDAERYFYYTCLAILNNSGLGTTLLTSRLPYGSGDGDNVADAYTLLAYPVVPFVKENSNSKSYGYYTFDEATDFNKLFTLNGIVPTSEDVEIVISSANDKGENVKIVTAGVTPNAGYIPTFASTYSQIKEHKPTLAWEYGDYSGTAELDIYSELTDDNAIALHLSTQLISGDIILGYFTATLKYEDDILKECFNAKNGYLESNNSGALHFVSALADETPVQSTYVKSHKVADDLSPEDEDVTYVIGAPATFNVSLNEYYQIISGEYFVWSKDVQNFDTKFGSELKDTLSKAAFITINTSRSTLNDSYEGFYFGITDNIFNEPSSLYSLKSVNSVKFTNWTRTTDGENPAGIVDTKDANNNKFISIGSNRLDFHLDSSASGSISSVLQNGTTSFDVSSKDYDDTVNFAIFNLYKNTTGLEAMRLGYSVREKYNASFGKTRVYSTSSTVSPQNYFVENIVESSKNLTILVNPYVANKIKIDINGDLRGKVRFLSSKLVDIFALYETEYLGGSVSTSIANSEDLSKRVKFTRNNIANWATICERVGAPLYKLSEIAKNTENYKLFNLNDSLYPFATYTVVTENNKFIGSTPAKISRALELVSNDEEYPDIDIIVEGGLGTIYAYSNNAESVISEGSSSIIYGESSTSINSETKNNAHNFKADAILQGVEDLRTGRSSLTEDADNVVQDYIAVQEAFQTLANSFQNGGRGDTFYIADILRGILLRGANTKVEKLFGTKLTNNAYTDGESVNHSWATSIYNPIKHIVEPFTTSYASIYAQWVKILDGYTNEKFWMPVSGYMTALMCAADQLQGPWYAAAGLNRGIVEGVLDCAVNPNQKQRGDLYKICVNSVPNITNIGITNWGIRTLSKKASAFDQNTCRRTFLFIEKAIKKLLRYYLFEPNNSYTQLSIYNEIEPYMESIRNQGGVYSYSIVCGPENNTDEIVNAGNLAVDVSAAPTRTAEFIVLNMTANKYSNEVSTSELNG